MISFAAFGFVTLVYVAYALFRVLRKVKDKFKIDLNRKRFVFVASCDDVDGRRLVQVLDELGLSVFAGCYTRIGADKIKQTCSERVLTVVYDVMTLETIDSACACITRNLPGEMGLWAMVLNHRVCGDPAMFEWTSDQETEHIIRTNLINTVYWCRKLLPWIRRERGRIVMTTSYPPTGIPTWVDYGIATAGIDAMYDSLRQQLSKTGVTFHLVKLSYVNPRNTGREQQAVLEKYNHLTPGVQAYYGQKYVDYLVNQMMRQSRPITDQAIQMYVGAVTHMLPSSLYSVEQGWLDWFLQLLPAILYEQTRQFGVPIPEGMVGAANTSLMLAAMAYICVN